MRPGFLGGFDKMVPKAVRNQQRQQHRQQQLRRLRSRRGFHGLGAFGKGFVAPPPPGEPTTLKPPSQIPLKNAINTQTHKWYQQDVRCPEGEIMRQASEPCQGADCCDAPGDCDPPGTIYQELECDDDPAYRQLPPPPPGGFPDCDAFYKAGYLPPCNKETCASCFAEKKKQEAQAQAQPQQAQEAGPSQVVIIAPPQAAPPAAPAGPSPEELALEKEIEELEDEAEELPATIPQPEAVPPPVYTGSPPPSVPRRAIKTGPASTEEKVQELVSQYQEQKVVERYQSPVRTIFMTGPGGPAGPAPVRRGPVPSSPGRGPGPVAPAGPGGPPKPGLVTKVFGWLNQTLFG